MMPELNCSNCGGNRFRFPPAIQDKTQIECEDCGVSVGTFEELKALMAEQVLRSKQQ